MDNLSYASSYPESGESSPRSRDIDDPTQSFEEPQPPPTKAKFLCSYGGRIQPRPHDNHLSYVGGDTKILSVDRHIRFSALLSKLAALSSDPDLCLKYQLPGEDLDALVSVTDDEDLSHMMAEYDRLSKSSPRPARLRLFLFRSKPGNPNSLPASADLKPDQQWFVDALNSPPPAAIPPPAAGNPDYLFGLEAPPEVVGSEDPPPPAAKKPTEEEPVLGNPNSNPCCNKPVQEMPAQAGYFHDQHLAAGGFPEQQQPVFLVAAAATPGVYQAQGLRPVSGQIGHYYGVPAAVYNPLPFHAPKANYVQVGLDSAGRQVYYTAAPPYQVVAADGRGGGGVVGALNQESGGGGGVPTQASPV